MIKSSELPTYPLLFFPENCNLQKFKFQVEFGIRAEDQNIYRFTLSLMALRHDPRIYDEDYYIDRKLSFPITYF